jgi:hypothetical protein
MEKVCRICRLVKTVDCFTPHKSTSDRRSPYCRPCTAEYNRNRRKVKGAQQREWERQWRAKNPDKVQAIRIKKALKLHNNPKLRLTNSFRSYIYQTLKRLAVAKNSRAFSILGYSPSDLRAHIERQFLPGMSWVNYGEWHVDHIRPLASFCYVSTEDDDFKQAWALSNLRPLWASDNMSKGAQLIAA